MGLIRTTIEVEVEMAIQEVMEEDLIILVPILGSIMVNLLVILPLGFIMVLSLEMPLILLNFLDLNPIFRSSMVLVLLLLKFQGRIFLIPGLLVRFMARMVTLPWIVIIA